MVVDLEKNNNFGVYDINSVVFGGGGFFDNFGGSNVFVGEGFDGVELCVYFF